MKRLDKSIYVTRPQLPPLAQLVPMLEDIWQRGVVTNGGPYHERFELALSQQLGVAHLSLFANATIALIVALRHQGVTGEVITTPFSFVATAHAIKWCGADPVFVDIDRQTLNLDPARIEAAITPRTTAILPVHCYGHPCDVEAIESIARRHGLKVIYDAAHAFGVRVGGRSLLANGDLSVVSFHATKVFNTFEGGAVVCRDANSRHLLEQLKNFGIVDEEVVDAIGLNGKMSEFNAALGLLQLEGVADSIARRKDLHERYRSGLAKIDGITLIDGGNSEGHNFSYCPVLVERPFRLSRDELYEALKGYGINTRRYFYPLLSTQPMYSMIGSASVENLPVATWAAAHILCLPIYPSMGELEQAAVIDAIRLLSDF